MSNLRAEIANKKVRLTGLAAEIAQKKAELAELEGRLSTWENLPEEYQVAEKLHSMLCHWNHTDGCSWEYESWKEPRDTRMRYVEKAENLLAFTKGNGISTDVLFDLLEKIYE